MPTTVFEKMNLKDEPEVIVLNAPKSFDKAIATVSATRIRRTLTNPVTAMFAVVFATTQAEVDTAARSFAKTAGDIKLWVAYPKQSSKRYVCQFNRDTGWGAMGQAGFEPVRQVAIDEDWSALRFRRAEFIKTLTRAPKHAISAAGKRRAKKSK